MIGRHGSKSGRRNLVSTEDRRDHLRASPFPHSKMSSKVGIAECRARDDCGLKLLGVERLAPEVRTLSFKRNFDATEAPRTRYSAFRSSSVERRWGITKIGSVIARSNSDFYADIDHF